MAVAMSRDPKAGAADFKDVLHTIQALGMMHADARERIRVLVVDNAPDSPYSPLLAEWLRGWVPRGRYLSMPEPRGTAAPRQRVFEAAETEYVLCMDSHVFIEPGALGKLLAYFDARPDCGDLLQGPILSDNLQYVMATHMEPVWSDGMFGTWAVDERGRSPDAEPFEIPSQGLGLFACRKDAWLGFNKFFRGFGGEEGYLHAKYKQAGRQTLCLPFLRWWHDFLRYEMVRRGLLESPYRLASEDKLRNYLIAARELGLSPDPATEHFRSLKHPVPEESVRAIIREVHDLPLLRALLPLTDYTCVYRGEPLPEKKLGDHCGRDHDGRVIKGTHYDVFPCRLYGENVTLEKTCRKVTRYCGVCLRCGDNTLKARAENRDAA